MKPGTKANPLALHLARGNPGKRKHEQTVEFRPGVPDPPRFLDAVARKEWDRMVEELVPGVLAKADQIILAGYCLSVSRAIRAERRARRDASQEARAEKAWEAVRKFGALFGLGPAERTRIKAGPQADPADARRKRFFGDGERTGTA